jgi:hypothetical protein
MRRAVFSLVTGFVLALVLVLANPSDERHREAMSAAIAARRPLAGALGLGFLKSHVPEYHSWLICSYTTHDGRLTSAGAAGYVWVNDAALDG